MFFRILFQSFKRRYVCLRQEVDGTHILEFHKDDRKTDSKGALCMDFCNKVVRVRINFINLLIFFLPFKPFKRI